MTDQELIQLIRKCRNSDLSDGMDALGLVNKGTMTSKMRPIRPGITFAGFAFTVKLIPAQKEVKVCKTIEEYYEELNKWCSDTYTFNSMITEENAKDMVVCIDMDGYPGGIWGSEIGASTKIRGIEGVVIDGGCRDIYECNLEKINVFCTTPTFNHVYGRLVNGGVNIPIKCGGVAVNPGDIIKSDDDGVLVIPRDKAEEVVKFAVKILEDDMNTRRKHYEKLGLEPDETHDRLK